MKKCHWEGNEFIGCCGDIFMALNKVHLKLKKDETTYRTCNISYCPFCGASLEKPVEIKKGMFGTFYNNESDKGKIWGELTNIYGKENRYCISGGRWFKYFSPGLPEGYNQDGTPKKEGNNE